MNEKKSGDHAITMFAVGDVHIARKEWQLSFAKVESLLKAGDINFFNCENPYAESGSISFAPHGAGPHDPRVMPALLLPGFNVCTLANNHTMDWGVDAVVECRERLEALGIAVCGAGRNMAEARKPAMIEKKGVRVAFLGYNSIGPKWSLAEENKPGCAMVRVHTLYEPYDYQPGTWGTKVFTRAYREDLEAMIDDITKVRAQVDLVVMTNHWGVHHEPAVLADYEFEVGHAAIDAGADLVLGTSPHILKGIEVYRGKVIVHSLANFALERKLAQKEGEQRLLKPKSLQKMREKVTGPVHPDQSKSLILKCLISGGRIERVSYIPVMVDELWANPEPLLRRDPRAQQVFDYMEDISRRAGLSTEYSWDGDEVVVGG